MNMYLLTDKMAIEIIEAPHESIQNVLNILQIDIFESINSEPIMCDKFAN